MKLTLYAPYSCFPEGTPAELPAEFRRWAGEQLRAAGYDATVTDVPTPHAPEGSQRSPTAVVWISASLSGRKRTKMAEEALGFGDSLWSRFNHER